MIDRFRRAPEDQADTHTCCEQHGEPGGRAIFRFFIILAQFDLAVLAEGQRQAEDNKHGAYQEVEPSQIGYEKVKKGLEI